MKAWKDHSPGKILHSVYLCCSMDEWNTEHSLITFIKLDYFGLDCVLCKRDSTVFAALSKASFTLSSNDPVSGLLSRLLVDLGSKPGQLAAGLSAGTVGPLLLRPARHPCCRKASIPSHVLTIRLTVGYLQNLSNLMPNLETACCIIATKQRSAIETSSPTENLPADSLAMAS